MRAVHVDFHADAVILAVLILLEELVSLGIEEAGVRIERAQHAGDGAVVERFIGRDIVGKVGLDQVEDLGEGLEAGAEIILRGGRRGRGLERGAVHSSQETKDDKCERYKKARFHQTTQDRLD